MPRKTSCCSIIKQQVEGGGASWKFFRGTETKPRLKSQNPDMVSFGYGGLILDIACYCKDFLRRDGLKACERLCYRQIQTHEAMKEDSPSLGSISLNSSLTTWAALGPWLRSLLSFLREASSPWASPLTWRSWLPPQFVGIWGQECSNLAIRCVLDEASEIVASCLFPGEVAARH